MSTIAHSPNIARDTGEYAAGVLYDIKAAIDWICHATTQQYVNIRVSAYQVSLSRPCSEYLGPLSEESGGIWRKIELLPPVALIRAWHRVEGYGKYVHDSIRIFFNCDQYVNPQQTCSRYQVYYQQGNDDEREG